MKKTALIIGDQGQDGTLLRISLQRQGFKVVGVGRRRLSMFDLNTTTVDVNFSIVDTPQVLDLVKSLNPNEIYYLAAHHVSSEQNGSDNSPNAYAAHHEVHVVGLLNFLWAIRKHSPNSRLFYASSSLIFSGLHGPIQNENTPFTPTSFYGLTKVQGMLICKEFREHHGVFASTGILYNHESSIRNVNFLSKKLISSAHKISLGLQKELVLGDLSTETDWGFAPDYVEAFQLILRTELADEFVVATGEAHSVAEFAKIVFNYFGLDYRYFVRESNNLLYRRVGRKIGDSSKLQKITGWQPKQDFSTMVHFLVRDYLLDYNAIHSVNTNITS